MAHYSPGEPIFKAASEWKEQCLLGGGSLFSDMKLWTEDNIQALDKFYVQNLDEGEGTFFSKLEKQLAPAPPAAKQLAAEMFWFMYLIVAKKGMRAETKLFQIKKVWEWGGEPLPEDHWALGDILSAGISHPGTAYNTHRWREFLFFITMIGDWLKLNDDQKSEIVRQPWEFAKWLEAREYAPGRQLRRRNEGRG